MTKTAQAINEASWQETFKALWIAALRLVQRVINLYLMFYRW
jgi:hypothetical protein